MERENLAKTDDQAVAIQGTKAEPSDFDHVIKDFFAGTMAGVAIVFSGHPFE